MKPIIFQLLTVIVFSICAQIQLTMKLILFAVLIYLFCLRRWFLFRLVAEHGMMAVEDGGALLFSLVALPRPETTTTKKEHWFGNAVRRYIKATKKESKQKQTLAWYLSVLASICVCVCMCVCLHYTQFEESEPLPLPRHYIPHTSIQSMGIDLQFAFQLLLSCSPLFAVTLHCDSAAIFFGGVVVLFYPLFHSMLVSILSLLVHLNVCGWVFFYALSFFGLSLSLFY